MVAFKLAQADKAHDNRTVRQICDIMLGRVSLAIYNNASTDYKQFLAWLGSRADAPIRLIARADMKDWAYSQTRASESTNGAQSAHGHPRGFYLVG